MLELPPLSLYVHVPWCVKKCPYCDFNSHEYDDEIPQARYVEALCRDLEQDLSSVQGRPLESVFIGGGTPSLLSASTYETLFSALKQRLRFSPDIEITLEANPGTAEAERFRDFRSVGINRLSIGVQSFDDLQLQKLGRIHDSADARRAVELAVKAGFDNFNIDLMYGLPGQNSAGAVRDLLSAIELCPTHLSWYELTIEPNTVFYRQPPLRPDHDAMVAMEESGLEVLAKAGYQRYEVSAYCRDQARSRHNLNYWQFGDYLGIGAGAHGKISWPESNQIRRSRKRRQPAHYMAGLDEGEFTAEYQSLEYWQIPGEFLLNALRLRDGFSVHQFETCTGVTFSTISKQVDLLQKRGLLKRDEDCIYASERGYQFLNTVLEEFL